jgi:hypothetical protein
MRHRRPDTRTRVLRWLLAVLTIAGMGVIGVGPCPGDSPPAAAAASSVTPAGTAMTHSEVHGPADAADDACHLRSAATAAATTTVSAAVQPPAGFRTLPAGAPATTCKPRHPDAVALTDSGVCRT